ncbi:MAG: L,D-transpeptidase family protein [Eubacteriales bacterium]|nr:L,D-transpeptidase family protein [Eubacteriales bacterium]MDD4583190.1 L,D-transpeptidase family protein [Eubacteriales bacterium]
MRKYYKLLFTVFVLLAILLFLVNLDQGRQELLSYEKQSVIITEINEKEPDGNVAAIEDKVQAPLFPIYLQYEKYPITYTYFLVNKETVNIRSGPSYSEQIIRKAKRNEKLNYYETVLINTGDASPISWYHITWYEKDELFFGFVESSIVTKRIFQFDKMEAAVLKTQEYADRGKITYISNYKNQKGYAPLYHGSTRDALGNSQSQSAPGYFSLSNKEEFVYIGDGTLVRYLFSTGDYVRVEIIQTGETYYVPSKYIITDKAVHNLKTIVVIDRKNQNEAVYEKINETWTLISYTLATTGTTGEYAQPTPLGYYFAMGKRSQFLYYKDGTYIIQGYAPYAIRFSGGAYIHGVPVNYKYNSKGERITPSIQEYSQTIGTVPLSHKCVRNYTSHAQFLYDRYIQGEMVVVVIE